MLFAYDLARQQQEQERQRDDAFAPTLLLAPLLLPAHAQDDAVDSAAGFRLRFVMSFEADPEQLQLLVGAHRTFLLATADVPPAETFAHGTRAPLLLVAPATSCGTGVDWAAVAALGPGAELAPLDAAAITGCRRLALDVAAGRWCLAEEQLASAARRVVAGDTIPALGSQHSYLDYYRRNFSLTLAPEEPLVAVQPLGIRKARFVPRELLLLHPAKRLPAAFLHVSGVLNALRVAERAFLLADLLERLRLPSSSLCWRLVKHATTAPTPRAAAQRARWPHASRESILQLWARTADAWQENYECMELLGDAVLGVVASVHAIAAVGQHGRDDSSSGQASSIESQLSGTRTALVANASLQVVAERNGLAVYLADSSSDSDQGAAWAPPGTWRAKYAGETSVAGKTLADLVEALVAVAALHGGLICAAQLLCDLGLDVQLALEPLRRGSDPLLQLRDLFVESYAASDASTSALVREADMQEAQLNDPDASADSAGIAADLLRPWVAMTLFRDGAAASESTVAAPRKRARSAAAAAAAVPLESLRWLGCAFVTLYSTSVGFFFHWGHVLWRKEAGERHEAGAAETIDCDQTRTLRHELPRTVVAQLRQVLCSTESLGFAAFKHDLLALAPPARRPIESSLLAAASRAMAALSAMPPCVLEFGTLLQERACSSRRPARWGLAERHGGAGAASAAPVTTVVAPAHIQRELRVLAGLAAATIGTAFLACSSGAAVDCIRALMEPWSLACCAQIERQHLGARVGRR